MKEFIDFTLEKAMWHYKFNYFAINFYMYFTKKDPDPVQNRTVSATLAVMPLLPASRGLI
jgi:hypothetical protein